MNKKMIDSNIAWIGLIPNNWEILKHRNLFAKRKIIIGEKSSESDILSLTINGVIKRNLENNDGKIPESFDGYQIVKNNDLIMCLFDIDVTPRCIGLSQIDGIISPAYTVFESKKDIPFNIKYYYYWYLMLDNDKKLLHLSKNLRSSIKVDELLSMPIVYPPLKEQEKISKFLDNKIEKINREIENYKNTINLLEEYKKSLIYETVTGKIEV